MSRLLQIIGFVFIVGSLLAGTIQGIYGGEWLAALLQILGGFLAGIIFLALALILERLDENRAYLEELLERTDKPVASATSRPVHVRPKAKTKTALESLKDFKMNAKD